MSAWPSWDECHGGYYDGRQQLYGLAQKIYTIQVVGTAEDATGNTLQHAANVLLTL